MQNIKFRKILYDDIVNLLEAHAFVLNSFQNILETVITSSDINLSKERFSLYIDKYMENYISYKALQDEVSIRYIPVNGNNIKWAIEYYNKNFTVDIENCTEEEKEKMLEWGFDIIDE